MAVNILLASLMGDIYQSIITSGTLLDQELRSESKVLDNLNNALDFLFWPKIKIT